MPKPAKSKGSRGVLRRLIKAPGLSAEQAETIFGRAQRAAAILAAEASGDHVKRNLALIDAATGFNALQ